MYLAVALPNLQGMDLEIPAPFVRLFLLLGHGGLDRCSRGIRNEQPNEKERKRKHLHLPQTQMKKLLKGNVREIHFFFHKTINWGGPPVHVGEVRPQNGTFNGAHVPSLLFKITLI